MIRFASRATLVLALGISACSRDGPDQLPSTEFGEQTLTLVSPANDALWEVRDILEHSGTLWALTGSAPFVHGFAPSGARVAAFGVSGEGPGELRFPYGLWPGESDATVTVWDAGQAAALTLSSTGRLVSSRSIAEPGVIRADIRTVTFGDPFRVFKEAGAVVLGRYDAVVSGADDLWRGRLVRAFEDEAAADEVIVDFTRDLPGADSRPGAPAVLVPVPLWDGCPDGPVAVLDPIARTLYMFGPEPGSPDAIALPFEAAELGRDDKLRYMKHQLAAELRGQDMPVSELDQLAESVLAGAEQMFPRYAPIGVDLRCTAHRVWIQEFDGASHPLGYGPRWHTVSRQGPETRFAQVAFPPGFTPHRITESRALGVVTDSVSLQRLATVEFLTSPSTHAEAPSTSNAKVVSDQ